MNISGKCDYACRAMVELATNFSKNVPVSTRHISNHHDIPNKYLTHILLQLKRAELIRSIRGAQGGYLLTRHPSNITLLEIIEAIEGPFTISLTNASKDWHIFWEKVIKILGSELSSITLESIAESITKSTMFYI